MNGAVTVVVHLKARPGREEKVKEELIKLLEPTRKEQGCINYDEFHPTEVGEPDAGWIAYLVAER